MLVRIAVFLSTFLLPSPLNTFILGMACIAMILITTIFFPYKNRWVNVFEIFLLLDLVLIVQGVLYFTSTLNISEETTSGYMNNLLAIFTCISLIPVYITLVAFKVFYTLKAHPKLKSMLLKPLTKYLGRKSRIPPEDDKSALIEMNTSLPKLSNYTDLREPLLDDPEACDGPLSIVHSD